MNRRSLLGGILVAGIAPAFIRTGLMKLWVPFDEYLPGPRPWGTPIITLEDFDRLAEIIRDPPLRGFRWNTVIAEDGTEVGIDQATWSSPEPRIIERYENEVIVCGDRILRSRHRADVIGLRLSQSLEALARE